MTIQILQYEFLGPVPLSDWGPPMEKLVYLILSRDKDRFNIIYVNECEKTDDKSFFVQHEQFKCWTKQTIEKSLYLAILPMFDATDEQRQNTVTRIKTFYKPICNPAEADSKPDYTIRKLDPNSEKFSCPCCGKEMNPEQILEKSTVYRCSGCGISDTKLNS